MSAAAPELAVADLRPLAELFEDEDGPLQFACRTVAGVEWLWMVRHSVYRDRWVMWVNASAPPEHWQVLGWRKPETEAVPPPPPHERGDGELPWS